VAAAFVVTFGAIILAVVFTDSSTTAGLAAAVALFLVLVLLVASGRLGADDLRALRDFYPSALATGGGSSTAETAATAAANAVPPTEGTSEART
jgi:hypothetical protein